MTPDISELIPPPPTGPPKVVLANVQTLGFFAKDAPSKRWLVGFVIDTGEGRYMGTLLSKQSPKKLRKILEQQKPCMVQGVWSPLPAVGSSGERYGDCILDKPMPKAYL